MAVVAKLDPSTSSTSSNPRVFPGHLSRPQPRGVQKARCKAQLAQNEFDNAEEVSPTDESEFLRRFFALPSELRNEVYRQLLVQPCKFDQKHKETCRYKDRISVAWPGPSTSKANSCAGCQTSGYQVPQVQIFKSPFRSKWGRSQTNDYVCDNCYWDVTGRDNGAPCMKSLRCICTRRVNLEVLLINTRFYNEAAPIFSSENCFAFEYPNLLSGFLRAVRPQVRSWLRRISFMPSHDRVLKDDTTIGGDEIWRWRYHDEIEDPWGWEDIKSCWQLLRQCDGLTWLELEVFCLQRLEWALLIRLIHVNGSVIFSRRPGKGEIFARRIDTSSRIWLSIGRRKQVQTPTTELMIASMTDPRNMKAKTLKRHYAESTLYDIYGGNVYPPE